MVIFSVVGSGENGVKWAFCRSVYRTRKWGFRRENIRYALSGNRTLVPKCKPRPHHGIKIYYNSTVLQYIFLCNLYLLHFCNLSVIPRYNSIVFATQTLVFITKTQSRSVVSVSRIHSKKSKVVHHPIFNPILTPKVVTNPKITPKNVPKVVNTYKISNTIPSLHNLSTIYQQSYPQFIQC